MRYRQRSREGGPREDGGGETGEREETNDVVEVREGERVVRMWEDDE